MGQWFSARGVAGLRQAVVVVGVIGLLAGCNRPPSNRWQGYIEGEFVYVASPLGGALEKLQVQRGQEVKAGEPLFTLEAVAEQTARDEAERRLVQARADLEDAKKGQRPTELEALQAQVQQAQAGLALAEKELARQQQLLSGGSATQQDLDRARATRDQDQQRVAQLEAELQTAGLGARPDRVEAAAANVRALEAALARAEWDLSQKGQRAPQAGTVFDTLYREGEWAGAGKPVVVLLSPQNVKLRVFVPEPKLGSLHVGDPVQVFVDGTIGAVTGKVSFISPRAEYTPPVIYSRENRSKLVFRVEAIFDSATAMKLHPGQPVDVAIPSVP